MDYATLRNVSIPIARGQIEIRVYDRISVDHLMQHLVRSRIRSVKARRPTTYPTLDRSLLLPLIERTSDYVQDEE